MKKRRVFVFNPGGVSRKSLSDQELEKYIGIGLNPKRKKKSYGGKAMAKKKRTKAKKARKFTAKKAKRAKRVKRHKAKRVIRVTVKRAKKARRHKAKRVKKAIKMIAKKVRRHKAKRVKKSTGALRGPKLGWFRRKIVKLKGYARPSAAPSHYPLARNLGMGLGMRPVSLNSWSGDFSGHRSAAISGYKKRKAGKKGYRKTKGLRFPVWANPGKVGSSALANIKKVYSMPVLMEAGQITVGSIGAPVVGSMLSKAITKATGGKVAITTSGIAGYALQAVSGAALATASAMVVKKPQVGKNIILGTVGGIMADLGKKIIAPILQKATSGTTVSGMRGVRQDLDREVANLGAYATNREILNSALTEEF